MKDIKSLYLTAKSSGRKADITAYTEAIQDLIENNPIGYMTQLEYIIQSDIGLKTVKLFIEKNGFPIACYDQMIDTLNECIRKCEVYNKDNSLYTEMIEYFESFRKNHIHCFMMFENYNLELDKDNYIKTYYGKTDGTHQNRKIISGMIKTFGEAAIPDALITAKSINEDAVHTVLEFISNNYNENNNVIYEWMLTACKDISYGEKSNNIINHMTENCLSTIVKNVKNREHQLYREAVIMDRNDLMMEYSEDEINAIQEMISFKEYQMTWMDELNESSNNLQSDIYDLYEMLDGVIEEDVANSVIPMLPSIHNTKFVKEAMWMVNTRNKKTGEIPRYISANHDLDYGEEDSNKKKNDDKEPTLDDYRRPSASNNDDEKPASPLFPSAYNNSDDKPEVSKSNDTGLSDHDKAVINNYYYNYTNSMNKNHNINSYNKNSSLSDDHHTDNSKVTHINSHNKNNGYSLIPDEKVEEESTEENVNDELIKEESSKPWELNIFDSNNQIFEEGLKDFFKKVANKVRGFIGVKKSLANLQNMGTPANITKNIPMTVIGTNIPLNLNNTKTESVEENDDLIEESIKPIKTIKSIKSFFKGPLSEKDIIHTIEKLRSKFNADIIFVNPYGDNQLIIQQIGPASCVRTDRSIIKKLQAGESIDRFTSDLYGDSGEFQTVILVNSSILESYQIKNKDDLELIISHEHGHALTYDQLSLNDWLEYSIKRQVITSLVSEIYSMFDQQAIAEANFAYYKLKPERLANEAAHIDPMKLAKAVFKTKPTGHLDKIDLNIILNWSVPPVIMQMTEKAAKGNTNFTNAEMIANLTLSLDLYKKCIKDQEYLKKTTEIMETSINIYKTRGETTFAEAVGDADDNKPKSDHPVKDILTDIDRKTTKKQQETKRKVQNIQNVGRAAMKPINRTKGWLTKMLVDWKDADENKIKERMTDPNVRNNLFAAIKEFIVAGSLFKAGILLNPVFLFLSLARGYGKNKQQFRLRNEIIGELKTEMEVIDEKIRDADYKGDKSEKYKLMRFKNELNKKLIRVGGTRAMKKMI